jgi:hypothetical protein
MAQSRRCMVVVSLLATVSTTIVAYPNQLSYFNEFAGGVKNGHNHLLHSNVDWGQDFLEVAARIASSPNYNTICFAGGFPYDPSFLLPGSAVDARPLAIVLASPQPATCALVVSRTVLSEATAVGNDQVQVGGDSVALSLASARWTRTEDQGVSTPSLVVLRTVYRSPH